jgi:5-methylcytosine-specific restriction endonuclease McrA
MKTMEYGGRMRRVFPTKCQQCGEEFFVPKHRLERARFCSKGCSSAAKSQAASIMAECAQCGKPVVRKQSQTSNSKSGLFFCDRACKEMAQRIGGVTAIQPSHYGTTRTDYRETAFRAKPAKCEVCGYSEIPEVLMVHHVDTNHANNEEANLQVLCPTCHAVIHFRTRTGYWRTR